MQVLLLLMIMTTARQIGASALLAKELDDSMGGAPVQVRVVQGKEPAHFRQLFKGTMIIHAGGKASGAQPFPPNRISLSLRGAKRRGRGASCWCSPRLDGP